ncbi:hypothetical protein PoB_000702700 [Plakobranchus ocellatus]|uniref:Uncharacterized protein n=1 Tax=Plakobranchus ocellatus TaxID=259542 RepID=A0AAV3YC90_9GAST|nr:hypothetical protein PoB_000702700 [Plakobranchus ocellatus]
MSTSSEGIANPGYEECEPTLTATSVLQVSHDKSRRLQCGPTLRVKSLGEQQSTIKQESLVPWLTSANSSSLTATGHNMAAMLIVPKNRQSQGGRKEGSAVGGRSAQAAIY